ncbi:zinc carboxypeptidase, putative [Acetobacter orientalis]|uniref:Zinc carboxypeptidase, putative n=1 Tax=Acetobacter orientalis TaxID=146474 RepID=A0A2Z5ZK16_9PROT|nr:zinc carboxypeptidase, putative [Acetobacter orientalis]
MAVAWVKGGSGGRIGTTPVPNGIKCTYWYRMSVQRQARKTTQAYFALKSAF